MLFIEKRWAAARPNDCHCMLSVIRQRLHPGDCGAHRDCAERRTGRPDWTRTAAACRRELAGEKGPGIALCQAFASSLTSIASKLAPVGSSRSPDWIAGSSEKCPGTALWQEPRQRWRPSRASSLHSGLEPQQPVERLLPRWPAQPVQTCHRFAPGLNRTVRCRSECCADQPVYQRNCSPSNAGSGAAVGSLSAPLAVIAGAVATGAAPAGTGSAALWIS